MLISSVLRRPRLLFSALVCFSLAQTTYVILWSAPSTEIGIREHLVAAPVAASDDQSDQGKKTLALLYPPGMAGGYRNQVIRLTGFVHFAIVHNIEQILLPTMLWSTTYKAVPDARRFYPVPMASLFDVMHWNSFAQKLPILVNSVENGDCWHANTKKSIQLDSISPTNSSFYVSPMAQEILDGSAFLTPLRNVSDQVLKGALMIKPGNQDFYAEMKNCTRPFVYGGGTKAGRLWNDYLMMLKSPLGESDSNTSVLASELISLISQALRPSARWRDAARTCVIQKQTPLDPSYSVQNQSNAIAPYIALHARVEVDMLEHRCSSSMEKNLTTILAMVDSFKSTRNKDYHDGLPLDRIFLAVSRRGMQKKTQDVEIEHLAAENFKALRDRTSKDPSIFECGEDMMRAWYSGQEEIQDDYYGSLLPSLLNFYIATQATIFIGVAKSSWSTDVWTTRYYQGQGKTNFQYTPSGIAPVENAGLPLPHRNCKKSS